MLKNPYSLGKLKSVPQRDDQLKPIRMAAIKTKLRQTFVFPSFDGK